MLSAYQVDCSKELITWAKEEKFSMLDVNVFAKPFSKTKVGRHGSYVGGGSTQELAAAQAYG